MEGGALSTDEFKEFGKSVVLFSHVTSKVEGEKYPDLLTEKGGRGFPYLVVMDAEGEVIAKPAERTVEAFRQAVKDGERYRALAGKKELSLDERIELLVLKAAIDKVTYEEAKAEADAMEEGLSEAQKAALLDVLTPLEIQYYRPKSRAPEEAQKAGEHYYGMMKAGREPKSGPLFGLFYSSILEYAYGQKDAETFGAALEKLRGRFGENPRAKGFFDSQERRLEELKAGAEER